MKRPKLLTAILCTLLITSATIQSSDDDATDVRDAIIQSMSQNFQDYLGYQSNVVQMYRNYSNNRSATNSPELHFLGGDYNNHDIIINGLSFRNPLTGIANISLTNSFFDNIKIHNGNIPIQFSNTNSAVIELASPKLTTGLQGSFETLSDNIVGNNFDQNYYRAIFAGSLPQFDKLKFWTAIERKWLGDRMPSSLTSEILSDSPDMLPNNQLSGWTFHGKVQFEITQNSRFTFTTDAITDEWQEYRHNYNNPSEPSQISHTPRCKDETYGINALYEHLLSENTDVNLSIGYYKSENIIGDGVLFDDLDSYSRDFSNPEYGDYELFREGYISGSGDYYEAYYTGFKHHISSYKQLRTEINHTAFEIHNIKAGLLYKKFNLRYFNHGLATLENASVTPDELYLNRYGFDSLGNESDNESWRNDTKQPTELSLYLNDNVSLENITIDFGVRIDRFDYDAMQIKNPNNPFDPDTVNAADQTLDEIDLVKPETQSTFNPHIGLTINPNENVNLYINWSQNHQNAPYSNMYVGWDYFQERNSAGFFSIFPNSLIEPVKSQTFTGGVKAKLNDNIKISAYVSSVDYKKQVSGIEISPAIPRSYAVIGNLNYSKYLGQNISIQFNNHKNLTWFIDLHNSRVTGTGTNSAANRNILWKNSSGVPKTTNLLDHDRSYKIVAGASFKTSFGLKINLIATQESASPMTPMLPYDAVTSVSVDQNPTGAINSSRTDKIRVIDLKLEKEFKFFNKKITTYLLVKNLLDEKIITGVYPGTGSPTNTGFLDTSAGRMNIQVNGEEYLDRYTFLQNNPLNFGPPRQIFLGIKTSF